MKLVDSHAHLDHKQFDSDRIEVIARAKEVLEFIVNPGVDSRSNHAAIALAEQHKGFIYAAVGLEPPTAGKMTQQAFDAMLNEFRTLAPKCVGLGEVGLDYHWEKDESRQLLQQERFKQIIDLCRELNKTLIVHTRKAMDDTLVLLEKDPPKRVVMHHFDVSSAVQRCTDSGFFMSVCTSPWSKRSESLIKNIPANLLLTETDSPYNCPVQGQRNEPIFVKNLGSLISSVKGDIFDEIVDNSFRAFDLR